MWLLCLTYSFNEVHRYDVCLLFQPFHSDCRVLSGGRRERCPLSKTEELSFKHHGTIRPIILAVHEEILCSVFKEEPFRESMEKRTDCESSVLSVDLCSICELAKLVPFTPGNTTMMLNEALTVSNDIFGHMVCNDNDHGVVLEAMQIKYHIPGKSAFLMSDLSRLDPLVEFVQRSGNKFNVVVLDPPWRNKSVTRSKKYASLSFTEISTIPLVKILAHGALVMVWATNNRHVVNYISHVLFPNWSIDYVTEWFWLKVTTSGQMVCDLDSLHRKPYETLVIGIFKSQSGVEGKVVFNIPSDFIISSIPTVQHSQKPYLGAVIKHCLPPEYSLKGAYRQL